MEFVKDPVLKERTPESEASPVTASRLLELPLRKILRVPPVMLRLPMERVPTADPLPGVIDPLLIVTAELVADPVPEKAPPLSIIPPLPVLVPLTWSDPP